MTGETLSQKEIDKLMDTLLGRNEGNEGYKNFAIEVLNEKLTFLENKKTELLKTIEKEYDPNIDSLKKAISILKNT